MEKKKKKDTKIVETNNTDYFNYVDLRTKSM